MYDKFANFKADYHFVSTYYEKLTKDITWLNDPDLRLAYDIYQQARHQQYGILVMGRTCVDEAGRKPEDFGNAITKHDHQQLGVITHKPDQAGVLSGQAGIDSMTVADGGMIMHFYQQLGGTGYHFLYNDAWLIGGAHGIRDFNLASPRTKANIWAEGPNRLTATGREVVILDSFGYRIRKIGNDKKLEVYVSANDRRARSASLVTAVNAVKKVTKFSDVMNLCDFSATDSVNQIKQLWG